MAALSSAKSVGAAAGKTERHRGRGGAADGARLLTQEEARCPVCSEIFLEPVTMPCRHSVCLPCFRQTVEQSTLHCCPLCRLRVSGWARRQSRENSLVNAELWDMVRRSYPERCERRMEQEQGQAGEAVIFRAPVHICKPGEIQQEYEKKKVEKEKGEKASGQLIQKILEGDWRQVDSERQKKTLLRSEELASLGMSEEKRRVQIHYIEEEGGKPKYFPDSHGVLSDSENEEPIGKRTRHVSAFVRKTRNSPASSRILQNHAVQRSRSCTDSEEDRQKNSCPLQLNAPPKSCITYSHNAGILLSSENSRSLSAPILFPDKKHTWRGVAATATIFVAPQAKAERSISPESNDSISEELNHFKPIVCSPCTPPKRLPDGRVVEPTIVKSTPRNLSRSLQKPTSYEASPTILQKWKQIEIDRQGSKVISKGTITSPFTEDFTLGQSSVEKGKVNKMSLEKHILKDHLTVSTTKTESSGHEMVKMCNKQRLIFDQPTGESSISVMQANKACTLTMGHFTWVASDAAQGVETGSIAYSGSVSTVPDKKDAEMAECNQKLIDMSDQNKVSFPRHGVKSRPTSRKGRKRSQKTKHLEDSGTPKKLRTQDEDVFVTEFDENCLIERRLQQEKDDHKLALKLQRQFNKECQKVDRRKISPERYLLRSWVSTDCQSEYNPRRSGRISKRKEHFN